MLSNAVDLKKAKMYKIGERNLITLFNSFEIAIGNTQSVMGLEKKGYYLPVPVTVLDRSIYEFCTDVASNYFIMVKSPKEKLYSDIFYEISTGILEKVDFDDNVMNKITSGR